MSNMIGGMNLGFAYCFGLRGMSGRGLGIILDRHGIFRGLYVGYWCQ